MNDREWYYHPNGEKTGPVSLAELREMVATGKLKPHESVWKAGMAQWAPAQTIPDLFTPPPPPSVPSASSPPAAVHVHVTAPSDAKKSSTLKWVLIGGVLLVGGCCGVSGMIMMLASVGHQVQQDKDGDGGKQPAKNGGKQYAKIGEEVDFQDSKWMVTEAEDRGNTLTSNNQFLKDARTDGKFIFVRYKVTNNTNKEERFLTKVKLIDSKGREYEPIDKQAFYLPEGAKSMTLEALPASIAKEFGAIYEVPADAKELKFQTRAMSMFGAKRLVDLGLEPASNKPQKEK